MEVIDRDGDLCGDWADSIVQSQIVGAIAAGAVVIVNVALAITLTALAGAFRCGAAHDGMAH